MVSRMQTEIKQARNLYNAWKTKIKTYEQMVQDHHKQFYILRISNPLKEMKQKLAIVVETYQEGQVLLENTQNQTEILEYMKLTRSQDMVIRKYPFI